MPGGGWNGEAQTSATAASQRCVSYAFDRMVAVFNGPTADQQQPPWSDTRFVRMCAKDVAARSGVPPPLV